MVRRRYDLHVRLEQFPAAGRHLRRAVVAPLWMHAERGHETREGWNADPPGIEASRRFLWNELARELIRVLREVRRRLDAHRRRVPDVERPRRIGRTKPLL